MQQSALYKAVRMVEKRTPVPLVGVCVYEAVALTCRNKHTPPISVLLNRHKWLFLVFCGALGLHIWFYEEDDAQSCPVV